MTKLVSVHYFVFLESCSVNVEWLVILLSYGYKSLPGNELRHVHLIVAEIKLCIVRGDKFGVQYILCKLHSQRKPHSQKNKEKNGSFLSEHLLTLLLKYSI